MGKTIVKYRKDRDYGDDDYGTRNRRGVVQDTRVRRKVKYEEILEQFEDDNIEIDEDALDT